ncbi:MAG: sulfatase-like hydrolase/transferase [Chitinispirillaceae bacterium]|nr:sulfatase-like hydrolase/transferase [Chitinispirillaceae bacterium]
MDKASFPWSNKNVRGGAVLFLLLFGALVAFRSAFFIFLNPNTFSFSEFAYAIAAGFRFDLSEAALMLGIFLVLMWLFGWKNNYHIAFVIFALLVNVLLVFHLLDYWYFKIMNRRLDYLFMIYIPMAKGFLPSITHEMHPHKFFSVMIFINFLFTGILVLAYKKYAMNRRITASWQKRIAFLLVLFISVPASLWGYEYETCDSKQFKDIASLSPIVTLRHSFQKEKERKNLYAAHHKNWKPLKNNKVDTSGIGANVAALKSLHGIAVDERRVDPMHPIVRPFKINRNNPVLQNIHRHIDKQKPPNIVIIMVESLCATDVCSWYKKAFKGSTPVIDSLCKKGIKLSRYYTTNGFTINSLISVLASAYPRLGMSVTSTDLIPFMLSISDILKKEGYATAYMKCGSIKFENVDRFTELHNFDLILGKEDFPKDCERIPYGIADHVVYREAARWMNENRDRPTFVTVASLVNHHPWDLPDPRFAFYDSSVHYFNVRNCIRYSDWAVGDFIRKCEEYGLADNTIFFIMADHTADWKYRMEVKNIVTTKTKAEQIWIPCFIYAPAIVPPEIVYDFVASHVDIAPTILDMLSLPVETPFVGKSIFSDVDPRERFAVFIGAWSDYQLAVVSEKGYHRIDFHENKYESTDHGPVNENDIPFLNIVKKSLLGFNALLNTRMLWDGARNVHAYSTASVSTRP